ncbi:MAG: LacI family DNA-binding transcriptional regulator [Verrucomicrobium sp.]|nr:LacI family DNA-binding transcriptional regulator [Verrucomicrobium sp.]
MEASPFSNPGRPTIRDIAQAAGCHYSTVSLALHDHPRIPSETRVRIRKIAEDLGYAPDAALSALCAYRERKRPRPEQAVLAWLTNYHTEDGWRGSPCNVDYFEGASRRAAERGYRLEPFWLAAPSMTPRRMSKILWTRGIPGILLPPQEERTSLNLAWEHFAAVTFGHSLVHPRLHLAANHEYRSMGILFEELVRRRYGRIGLVDLRAHDERVDHNWLAAYLIKQQDLAGQDRLPPLLLEGWDEGEFLGWVRQHRPDVIVTKLPAVLHAVRKAGYRVPRDLGVAFHSMEENAPGISGMKKNSFQVGVMAVDLLVDMLHRGERGVPERPSLFMVEGSWAEGETLRSAAPSRAKKSSSLLSTV